LEIWHVRIASKEFSECMPPGVHCAGPGCSKQVVPEEHRVDSRGSGDRHTRAGWYTGGVGVVGKQKLATLKKTVKTQERKQIVLVGLKGGVGKTEAGGRKKVVK